MHRFYQLFFVTIRSRLLSKLFFIILSELKTQ